MRADEHWWKYFFNEIYLITDARSVCDRSLSSREVDLLEKVLQLNKEDKILDLCGGYGRHSLELARRGYQSLTVLDFSRYLTKLGKQMTRQAEFKIKFLCRDARCTGIKSADYSVIFVMANSFGYFPDEKDNFRILQEMHRLLKTGGRILLDLTDPLYARKKLKAFSYHQANQDIVVLRQRRLRGNIMRAREIVISKKKGLLRDGFYCERIYNKERISALLKDAGFAKLAIRRNPARHEKRRDYGLMSSRMLVSALKP